MCFGFVREFYVNGTHICVIPHYSHSGLMAFLVRRERSNHLRDGEYRRPGSLFAIWAGYFVFLSQSESLKPGIAMADLLKRASCCGRC